MNCHLIDLSIDNIDFDFDNLIIGRKISTEDTPNSKYYIYYQKDENDIPKEIYIKYPKFRLIYNLANYKYNQLNIPIYPNWQKTNNLIKFIKNLENNILECFNKKNIDAQLVSLINKKNSISFIKTSINENIKITSNIDNNNIKLNDFKINSEIEIVNKLSYIWNKDNKFGLSSQLYQIKYYGLPEQTNINFIDMNNIYIKSEPIPKQNNIINTIITIKDLPPNRLNFKIPSALELKSARSKLNKTETKK